MAKIGYPTLLSASKALDHVLNRLRNVFVGTVENTRVSVALEDNLSVSPDLYSLSRVDDPIQANDVVADIAH